MTNIGISVWAPLPGGVQNVPKILHIFFERPLSNIKMFCLLLKNIKLKCFCHLINFRKTAVVTSVSCEQIVSGKFFVKVFVGSDEGARTRSRISLAVVEGLPEVHEVSPERASQRGQDEADTTKNKQL